MRKYKTQRPAAEFCRSGALGGTLRRGVFALVPVACLGLASLNCAERATERPNVLFLLIDSLRSDHLGFAGYGRPTSPCLDALASEGAAFTSCTAQAPWTQPSVPSLLTGRYPTSVFQRDYTTMPTTEQRVSAVWLGEGIVAVPSLLREHGYVTAAFSASLPVNHRIIGLPEQFDHFDGSLSCAQGDCAAQLNAVALEWLREPRDQPWFCYVHYTDVHHPYDAPPEYAARFSKTYRTLPVPDHWWMQRPRAGGPTPAELEHTVGMYDGEIAYLDDQICRLLAEIKSLEGGRKLLVVVASDHGDEFYEHGGFSHGQSLYEELTRCPLIITWPGEVPAGAGTDQWVQNVDIVPTILDLLGIPVPEHIDGESLRPYFEGRPRPRPAFSEQQGASVRAGRWKLWQDRFGALRLYDLESDPGESANVVVAELDTLRALSATLERWKSGLQPPPVVAERPDAPTLDPVTEERMRALGYLE